MESPLAGAKMDEPTLCEIQKLFVEVHDTVKMLLKTSFQLSTDVAELKNSKERNRQETTNLKDKIVNQKEQPGERTN